MALVESEAALCPSCAQRCVDTAVGFCSPCAVERVRENYTESDREAVNLRSISWSERTTRRDAGVVKLRQQRHRLKELVRPREPARSDDPWEIAATALHELRQVRTSPEAREAVAEALRRLAWGPGDD